MKRRIFSLLCVLSLAGICRGQVFNNVSTILAPTNIVAQVFLNHGIIDFVPIATNFTTRSNFFSDQIFMTHQTKYWTNFNNGLIAGQPGFNFLDVDNKGYQPSSVFNNEGSIISVSIPVEDYLFYGNPPELWDPIVTVPAENSEIPDSISISANTVLNSGTIQVGDLGTLKISGQNVELNNGTLLAGSVDDSPTNSLATVDRGSLAAIIAGGTLYPAFSPPADVYDLFWSATNSESFTGDVVDASDIFLSSSEVEILDDTIFLGSRNGTIEGVNLNIDYGVPVGDVLPMSGLSSLEGLSFPPGNWTPYVLQYNVTLASGATNYYVAVVLVNGNFADTNISYQVGVLPGTGNNVLTNQGPDGFEYMVKFSAPLVDVASGEMVTNSVWIIDSGAAQTPAQDATNALDLFEAKPTSIEITRQEPVEWEDWLADQASYPFITGMSPTQIEDLLYTSGESMNETTGMTNVAYGALIGRNPEDPNGLFPFTKALLGTFSFDLPNLTNEIGQIQINSSGTLNLNNSRIRANGVATINAQSVVGSPAGADYGDIVGSLGNSKANMVLSNVIPPTFTRLRGDILCWSQSWLNTITNDGSGSGRITNTTFYHVLVVDQDLRSIFKPSALGLNLNGKNVTVDDQLNVIGTFTANAGNLTLNNALNMTGNSPNLTAANFPGTQNLTVGPSGSISADYTINLNVPLVPSAISPLRTKYSIQSITNDSLIQSGAVELQAANLDIEGNILAKSGQIVLQSKTNLLGVATGGPTTLSAGSDVELYSGTIEMTNTSILAGQTTLGHVVLTALNELTDFHGSASSTNSYATNLIEVSSGFSLPVKPLKGDLFGTEIISTANSFNQIVHHTWSATDMGPTAAGFLNNAVIGHLVLDRTASGATFQFSAGGKKSAMYVDYLELKDLAFSDYQDGLLIDPNMTIYFGSANVEPSKLNDNYTNLVWVPSFAGPNSSTLVSYEDGSTCLMNASLATSRSVSSSLGNPNFNNPFPLNSADPYVNAVPCPSLVTSTDQILITNTTTGFPQALVIWTTGKGSITPMVKTAKPGQVLNLTAVPAKGWLFLDWSGGVSSTSPTISFQVPNGTNAGISANFVTNVLPQLSGSYNGLFYQNGTVQSNSSGFVTFTMSSTGVTSGKLLIGTKSYPFNTAFNGAGLAMTRATNGTNVVTVTLQLDTTNLTNPVTGSVANGIWESPLQAVQAQTKSASQAGYYTMALPGDADAATSPGGDSYATLTVSSQGTLSVVGALSDGVAISQSVPVSNGGLWPLYFAPSAGEEVLGWVQFGSIGFNGPVHWLKAPSSSAFYPNGFSTVGLLTGDRYSPAANGGTGLNFTSGTLNLTGGNLGLTIAASVTQNGKLTYSNASTTLTVTPKTGTFTGSFQPNGGSKISFNGVVLPNEQMARGFFLGSSQSGEALLQAQ